MAPDTQRLRHGGTAARIQAWISERPYASFQSQLPGPFSLDPEGGLRHAGQPLEGRFGDVDAVGRNTGGGTATIFVRRGDEFVRIATSVKQQDGTRAHGSAHTAGGSTGGAAIPAPRGVAGLVRRCPLPARSSHRGKLERE